MGLPSDEETYQQEQIRRQNEDRRRQEQLEKEPVKLEDETTPDVSSIPWPLFLRKIVIFRFSRPFSDMGHLAFFKRLGPMNDPALPV